MPTDELKRCPYCGEQILSIAIKCKHCGSMLTDAPLPADGDGTSSIDLALASKYGIQQEIGRGGMAIVFKAVQKNLDRVVALKVLPTQFTHDREFLDRFHREARAAAKLSHRNIVTIYDEGVEKGIHFIAMEYLDGTDLHTLVKQRGRLDVEEAIGLIAPIAGALDYAHQRGVIHRDVKSSNIILTNEGRPVLMDFGIAHAVAGSKLTRTGTVIGTPEYMSPEQADGKELDGRSDQYSLGVVLFECLTGQLPFRGDNPLTVIHKVIKETPPLPSSLGVEVPGRVQSILLRALAKDPSQRYATIGEFGSVLAGRSSDTAKTVKVGSVLAKQGRAVGEPKEPGSRKKKNMIPLLGGLIGVLVVVLVTLLMQKKGTDMNMPQAFGVSAADSLQQQLAIERARIAAQQAQLEEEKRQRAAQQERERVEKEAAEQKRREEERKAAAKKREEERLRKEQEERDLAEKQRKEEERLRKEQEERDLAEKQRKEEEQRRATAGMVFVEGGYFEMGGNDGDSDERPVHRVYVGSFYMDKYEVTQAEYERVTGNNPSSFKCPTCPVENVSWNEATEYARMVGKRLPTEAEWEYAARGGNKSRGYKYSGSNNLGDVAWYDGNSGEKTHPVGNKQPNELGLYDMSGNVWEWCADWYDASYYGRSPERDPRGPSSGTGRVLRGGSWYYFVLNCRVALRDWRYPSYRFISCGFRCVRD